MSKLGYTSMETHDPMAMADNKVAQSVVDEMFEKGITKLTGKNLKKSFSLLFDKNDIVGIKVNPVSKGLKIKHILTSTSLMGNIQNICGMHSIWAWGLLTLIKSNI